MNSEKWFELTQKNKMKTKIEKEEWGVGASVFSHM